MYKRQPLVGDPNSETPENETPATAGTTDGLTADAVAKFLDRGPSYVLTLVEVEPETEASKLIGYRLATLSPTATKFAADKLTAGDVVTHVNGVRLVKPDDLMNAWKAVRNSTEIRVDFLRNGQAQNAVWKVQ